MASTGAVVYLRPRVSATTVSNRATGAQVFLPIRASSGVWTSTGAAATLDLKNLRTWLPPAMVPIGYVKGDRSQPVMVDTATWYRFLEYLVNTVLGGPTALTLPDVSAAVSSAAENSATSSATVAAVAQQAQANAEALAAVVQVAQDNSLPGSTSIPPVQQGLNQAQY